MRGLRLDSWNEMIKGSDFGEAVIPFDAENSLLYELMTKGKLNGEHQAGDSLTIQELDDLKEWIEQGAANEQRDIPYENSTARVIVCDQSASMVSVFDADAQVVIHNVIFEDLGFSDHGKPHDITALSSGLWFVSLINDNKVLKFDQNYALLGEADFEAAGLLTTNPSKSLLYAGHTLSIPTVPHTLAAINYEDMSLESISLPYSRPHGLVSTHGTGIIFNLSLVDNRIATINTNVNPNELSTVQVLPGGNRTIVQINIAPDNLSAVISSQLEAKLLILDLSDLNNITIKDSIQVGEQPWHPKYTPDGSRIYVGNLMSNTVSVVNTSTMQVETTIGAGDGSDGLAQPHGLVISPDGKYVYVSCRNALDPPLYTPRYNLGDNAFSGTLVIINTTTNQIEKVLEIEEFPSGLAYTELD